MFIASTYKRIRTALIILMCVSVVVLQGFGITQAAPNYQVNYQGKLTTTANVAVADGTYNMRFWLLTSPTTATTSAVWSESLTGTNRVQVTNGLFSIMLGSTSPLTSVDFSQTLYLGVEIGGTGTPAWDGEMSPRKILGTVPAAFEADRLDGFTSSQFVRTDATTTIASSSPDTLLTIIQNGVGDIFNIFDGDTEVFSVLDGGNIGVGTSTPAARFAVAGNSYFGGNLTATGTLTLSGLATFASGLVSQSSSTIFELTAPILLGTNATVTNATTTNLSATSFKIGGDVLTDITGTNLTITNGVLSATGDGVSNWTDNGAYLSPLTATDGISIQASSTIGGGTGFTGLTIFGNSTTTGTSTLSGVNFIGTDSSRSNWLYWEGTKFLGVTSTNVYLGISAGVTATTSAAGANTGIGNLALNTNRTGGGNTAIGNSAMFGNTSGTNNTGLGYATLFGNTSGQGNTAVGYFAGYVAFNSNNNSVIDTGGTFVGRNASRHGDLVASTTILTNLTAIGNESKVGCSNCLALGGFGSNSVRVGIGTSTPTAKLSLHAYGNETNAQLFTIASSTAAGATSTLFTILNTGNVGIGTTTPAQLLSVAGGMHLTGALYDRVYSAGTNGMVLQTTGSGVQWVATSTLGFSAAGDGVSNWSYDGTRLTPTTTTAGLRINASSTIGDGTGLGGLTIFGNSTTTGTSTPGGLNLAALDTTRDNWVYWGGTKLFSASSTAVNTYFGLGAGMTATTSTAYGNTAFGFESLRNNRTGYQNIAVGGMSLYSNTTGNNNIAVGESALRSNLTSAGNTAVGSGALYSSLGARNTAIGYRAGFIIFNSVDSSINDTNSTFIGYEASRDGTLVATGTELTNGIAIGYQSKVGCSNCLTLGGLGSNSVRVGIGTSTPSARLTVVDTLGSTTPLFLVASSTNGAGTTTAMLINAYGNVGIGTTTPAQLLSVAGGMHLTGALYDRVYSAGTNGMVLQTTGSGVQWVATSTLGFSAAGDGVSNWSYDGTRLTPTTTTAGLRINASSTIGDGTGLGGLTIFGNSTTTGTSTPGGLNLAALDTTRDNWVYWGGQKFIRASSTPAFQENLSVGLNAGINAGVGNTVFGNYALGGAGTLNIAVGNYAMGYAGNSAIGNIAVGSQALIANSSSYNVAIGNTALYGNAVGGNNIAVGEGTLYRGTGSSNNVIGRRAFYWLTSGDGNIAIGNDAGVGSGAVEERSFIDSYGTFLGYQSSRDGLIASSTAFTNMTAIGAYAKVGCSNCLTLGGLGSNSVRVGIGTSTPSARLTVVDTLGSTTPLFLVASSTNGAGTTTAMLINAYGNVGIGTTTPYAKLTIAGSLGLSGEFYDRTASAGTNGMVLQTTGSGVQWVATSTLGFGGGSSNWTDNGAYLSPLTGGDGIIVAGSSTIGDGTGLGGLTIFGNSTTTGTSTPGGLNLAALDTTRDNWVYWGGTKFMSASSTAQNTALGLNAFRNGTSSYNTAIGYEAMRDAASAYHNVAVGSRALRLITSGNSNVAVGHTALEDNTTGYAHVALGANTLASMVSAWANTAIGFNALFSSTAQNNTGIGSAALEYVSTGIGNTGIGVSVGTSFDPEYRSTIDSYSTFIGYAASRDGAVVASTTQISNATAIGRDARVGCSNCLTLGGLGSNSVRVGIGTSTPSARLTVVDTLGSTTPLFLVASSTNGAGTTTAMLINAYGNVAIGAGGLVVNGNSTTTGTSTLSGVNFFGADSTRSNWLYWEGTKFIGASTSLNSTYLGYQAGTTATNSVAVGNTAFGHQALRLNRTGISNTSVGAQALHSLTGANSNTAVGSGAMFSNLTGGGNTAVGSGALFSNLGSFNTALGGDAGYIGFNSVYSSINDTYSTFIGYQASRDGWLIATGTTLTNATAIGRDSRIGCNNCLALGGLGSNSVRVGIGTSTPSARLTVVDTLGSTTPLFLVASSTNGAGTTTPFIIDAYGRVGLGSTTPESLGLTIQRAGVTGPQVAGIKEYLNFTNSTQSAVYYGDNAYIVNAPTATSTLVGKIIRIEDSTSYGNTVRGLEVQAQRGTNTSGENTGISGFGRTFGVRGTTEGDAGNTFVPAGVFAETRGTTQGNAFRAYSGTITTATLAQLFHDTSVFSGTGLLMNFGNSGGSFAATSSAKFVDLQVGGTSKFTVTAAGTTTIGDGTTANMAGLQIGYGGLCVDNDGSCSASTTGRITSVSSASGNSDLAEMYFSNDVLETGEIVALRGGLSIERADADAEPIVLGVVSTKPGLLLGYDDESLVAGETAYPIGLKGRVPVRLSTENGPIMKGDRITLSSIPGVGMKATESSMVVGIALEDFTGETAYSAGYLNQFGDDLVKAKLTPRNQNTDTRTQDGCSYGAGSEQGGTPCVKEKVGAITPDVLTIDNRTEVLRELRRERALTATTQDGVDVTLGQALMFIDLDYALVAEERTILSELLATSTVQNGNGSETLWDRVKLLAQNFVDGVLRVAGIKTDELCVGAVCVDEAQFLRMVEQASGGQATVIENEPQPDPESPIPEEQGEEVEENGGGGGEVPPQDQPIEEQQSETSIEPTTETASEPVETPEQPDTEPDEEQEVAEVVAEPEPEAPEETTIIE